MWNLIVSTTQSTIKTRNDLHKIFHPIIWVKTPTYQTRNIREYPLKSYLHLRWRATFREQVNHQKTSARDNTLYDLPGTA